MDKTLFLQSDVSDPYAVYAMQPALRYDDSDRIWAAYSHETCREVLTSDAFGIPPACLDGLDAYARELAGRLARLANPPHHAELHAAALRLHGAIRRVNAGEIAGKLIGGRKRLDWVNAVCRKLPALLLLEGFGFSEEDIGAILPQMETLTKIMAPRRSAELTQAVNAAVAGICPRIERHLAASGLAFANGDEFRNCAANLAGLLIQSVDAGRGLLANALLQALRHAHAVVRGQEAMQGIVAETLRYDPPIHNTRRIALRDTGLCGKTIRQGETVLVVLAAANRDARVFAQPDRFNPMRADGAAMLGFGAGIHECVARHFSARMAAEALHHVFDSHASVALAEAALEYEPAVNARLVKRMEIVLD